MMRLGAVLFVLVLLGASRPGAALAQSDPNLATKLAALDKLCSAGVFTAADCAQRHAALLGAAAPAAPAVPAAPADADAAQMFHDPDGRYAAPVPPDWNVSSNNGVARFVSGNTWVMLIPSPETKPEPASTGVINQIRQQYRSLDQTQSGRPKINGHDAVYATFRGVDGNGASVALMVAGIQAPGSHVLVFVSCAPLDSINAISPQFLAVLNGIRFAGE